MKHIIALSTLLAVTGTVSAADGWTPLFDGKTLDGWKRAAIGVAEYKVVDGTIYGKTVEGSQNTFLASEKEYGDFELEFEVKVHDKLNSGCQIRSREKTQADVDAEVKRTGKKVNKNNAVGRFFGPQCEIEASPGQSAYIYAEATGYGWRSKKPQDKSHSHNHMRNGEWNTFRIVAKGPRIQTWINGNAVEDITDEVIYKSHPKGKIGLQVHGIKPGSGPWDVAWKNIRIKELK